MRVPYVTLPVTIWDWVCNFFSKLQLWQLYFWGYIFPPCDSPNCGHLNVEVIKFNLKISSTCWERYVFKCINASTGKPLEFINYWLMIYSMLLLISRVFWSNVHVILIFDRMSFDQTSMLDYFLIKRPLTISIWSSVHFIKRPCNITFWSSVHLIKWSLIKRLFDQMTFDQMSLWSNGSWSMSFDQASFNQRYFDQVS